MSRLRRLQADNGNMTLNRRVMNVTPDGLPGIIEIKRTDFHGIEVERELARIARDNAPQTARFYWVGRKVIQEIAPDYYPFRTYTVQYYR
ncbi:MAG TPA: hypothetical protein VJH88_00010 [Candidatus Nanoarchaeia archaeon]|nr:hypothetical protein [Candidatus Nanoarchaeia archaeon]